MTLWLVPFVPLLLLVPVLLAGERRASAIAALAPLPALVLALTGPADAPELPWLLLGSELGLDAPARILLVLTSLVWLGAGVFTHGSLAERRRRFAVFWLLAMAGNLLLVAAADVVTFYAGFLVMTFAAYGLVVHDATPRARHAGRVYIAMAVAGEVALLSGLLYAVLLAGGALGLDDMRGALGGATPREASIAVALLVTGFGVKAGLPLLHMWLPLAHPAAPVPASAVLSGCMIKAGVLGWLRTLPLGEAALPTWGAALIAVGFAGAFLGVAVGALQRDAKVVLAYSSISQVGIMTAIVGLGLLDPLAGIAAVATVAVYALHHGLAKAVLFLGVGMVPARRHRVQRGLVMGGLALAAVSLAGAPLTSGAVAKGLVQQVTGAAPAQWEATVLTLLPLSSLATAFLLGRFLLLVAGPAGPHPVPVCAGGDGAPVLPRSQVLGWSLLLTGVLFASWVLPPVLLDGLEPVPLIYPAGMLGALWPVVAGAVAVWAVHATARRPAPHWLTVPPGDLIVPVQRGISAALRLWRRSTLPAGARIRAGAARVHGAASLVAEVEVARHERALGRWSVAGSLVLGLAAVLLVLMVRSGGA